MSRFNSILNHFCGRTTSRVAPVRRGNRYGSPSTQLAIEKLETRLAPSVNWFMSGPTLKIIGDGAEDWISIALSGNQVQFNGTGMPAPQSKMASQIGEIDIQSGAGNDSINISQTAAFLKPINVFGGDGYDHITIDLRCDGSARYTVDGGTGTDTVIAPGWMPVGWGGFPNSFWTNAEMTVLSDVAQAQASLRRNSDMTNIAKQIYPPITNGPNNRSAQNYKQLIEEFEIGYYSHARYLPDSNGTKCNIAAADIMRAMQVPLPTKDDLGGVDGGGTLTAGAIRLNQWLNGNKTWTSNYSTGPQQGWRKINVNSQSDLDLLLSHVRAGKPALASTASPGHIAVVRPDQDLSRLTKDSLGSLVLAQAGAKNFNRGLLSDVDGWKYLGYQNVEFFIQDPSFGKPSVPGSFRATAVSGTQVNLSWTASQNANGYRVYQWTGWQWQQIGSAGTTSYSVTGLNPNTTYYFYVDAYNTYGSAATNWVSVTTPSSKPTVPVSFRATAVSGTQVNLSWTASQNANGYRVYQWTGWWWQQIGSTGATSYSVTGLRSNTTYYFYVSAFNPFGSADTNWVSVVTLAR